MRTIRKINLILLVLFAFNTMQAQEAISIFGRVYADEHNGPGYFRPLSNVLNQSFSLHWHSNRPQSRIRVGIGLLASRSFIPTSENTFTASYISKEDGRQYFVDAPTLFGKNEAVVVTETNGYSHVFPGGLQYAFITIAQPQVTVEGILNSAASLRFLAFNIDEETGRFSNFGLSFLHHFAPYFQLDSSIILNASVGYEKLQAGQLWEAEHTFFQITGGQFSRNFHYYGSIGMQWFDQSISYEEPFENFTRKKIDVPATNNFLLKFGVGYQWAIISTGVEVAPLVPFSFGVYAGLKF